MRVFLIFILLLSASLHSQAASSIDVFAPTIQLRFENKENQEIGFNNYLNFMVAGTYDTNWWAGLSLDYLKKRTGNSPQLKVENNFYEASAALGYIVYSVSLDKEQDVWFELIPLANIGVNWSRVVTQVLGDSKADSSGTDLSLGAGGIAQLRFFSWIFQLDLRYLNSGVYQPSFVPATSVRIGFRIDL